MAEDDVGDLIGSFMVDRDGWYEQSDAMSPKSDD